MSVGFRFASYYFSRNANRQQTRRNVFGHDCAGPGGGSIADGNRGHQHGVAADERIVANVGAVFIDSVIVAGNQAGAEI
jgi:hypothetical protein